MAKALSSAPNVKSSASAARSGRRDRRPIAERRPIVGQLLARHPKDDAGVVVRAGLHAVEAEGALEIADLQRDEQPELAAALDDLTGDDGVTTALDAVHRRARTADRTIARAEFQRRERRGDEVELANRADVLAERGAGEGRVDEQRGGEIADHQPGGCRRQRPQIEQLVSEQDGRRTVREPATFREATGASAATADAAGVRDRGRGSSGRRRRTRCPPQSTRRSAGRDSESTSVTWRGSSAQAPVRKGRERRRSPRQGAEQSACRPQPPPAKHAPTIGQRSTSAVGGGGGAGRQRGHQGSWRRMRVIATACTLATSMRRSTRAPSGSATETSSTQSPCMVNANCSRRRPARSRWHPPDWRHSGVRHVALEPHPRAFHRITGRLTKGNRQGGGADRGRLRAKRPCDIQAVTRFGGFDGRRRSTGWRQAARQPAPSCSAAAGLTRPREFLFVYGTRALRPGRLSGRREQVVVHGDHHRDEHDGVVEEVQFDPRHPQLHEARGDRPPEQVVTQERLRLQQAVLDVVEELDPERGHPPEVIRFAGEAFPQGPEAHQHDQRVAVVHASRT